MLPLFYFMNNYIKTFKLRTRGEINEFIWDFADLTKMNQTLPVAVPHRPINYVSTFNLYRDKLINKFIEDFCQVEQMDDAVKQFQRLQLEDEMGLSVFREEDKYWRTKISYNRLVKDWHKRHGWQN